MWRLMNIIYRLCWNQFQLADHTIQNINVLHPSVLWVNLYQLNWGNIFSSKSISSSTLQDIGIATGLAPILAGGQSWELHKTIEKLGGGVGSNTEANTWPRRTAWQCFLLTGHFLPENVDVPLFHNLGYATATGNNITYR